MYPRVFRFTRLALLGTLLCFGCDKKVTPTNDVDVATEITTISDETSDIETVLSDAPGMHKQDWAWIPATPLWCEKFALSDPRAVLKAELDGLRISLEPPLKSMYLVYRNRLVGDFQIELELDVKSDPGATIDDRATFSTSLRAVGFQSHGSQPHTSLLELPPDQQVSETAGEPTRLYIQRKGDQLICRVNSLELKRGLIADRGYLFLHVSAWGELKIRRMMRTGLSDRRGYESPERIPAGMTPANWKALQYGYPDRGGEDLDVSFEQDALEFESKLKRDTGYLLHRTEFIGDFLVTARFSLLTPADELPAAYKTRFQPPFRFGVQSRNTGQYSAPVPFTNQTQQIWMTLVRDGDQVCSALDGQPYSRGRVHGPAQMFLRAMLPGTAVRVDELRYFAEGTAESAESPLPTFAVHGWAIDTQADSWQDEFASRISIERWHNYVRVSSEPGEVPPLSRLINTDGDFNARWNVALSSLESFQADDSTVGKVSVAVGSLQSSDTALSAELPRPAADRRRDQSVSVTREGQQVMLRIGSLAKEAEISGPIRVEIQPHGKTSFSLSDFRLKADKPTAEPPRRQEVAVSTAAAPPVKPTDRAAPSTTMHAAAESLRLPGRIDDIQIVAGGQKLLMSSAEKRKLILVDLAKGKIEKTMPVTAPIKFAGGMKHAVILDEAAKTLSRYRLSTLTRELTVPLPAGKRVEAMAMGAASYGPIAMTSVGSDIRLFDLLTLKELEVPEQDTRPLPGGIVRAAPDGTRFGVSSMSTPTITNVTSQITTSNLKGTRYVAPGTRYLYTDQGILNAQLRAVDAQLPDQPLLIPATEGLFYLSLEPAADDPNSLRVVLRHEDLPTTPVAILDDLRIKKDSTQRDVSPRFDRRVIYHPPSGCIAILGDSNDRLLFRKIEPMKQLRETDEAYLLVVSQPPHRAVAGQPYRYQVESLSNEELIKYELVSNPPGMSISATGEIDWTVPAKTGHSEHIIVRCSTPEGKSVFHTFSINPVPKLSSDLVNPTPVTQRPLAAVSVPLKPRNVHSDPASDKVIRLPAAYQRVASGGDGRYLLLTMPSIERVAIVDLKQRAIAKIIPADKDAICAGGLDKFVVVSARNQTIECFDYESFQSELKSRLDLQAEGAVAVAMGAASPGPVLVTQKRSFVDREHAMQFLDLKTLKPTPKVIIGSRNRIATDESNLRVSANGRVFAGWAIESSPSGISVMTVDGAKTEIAYAHQTPGYLVPNHDGSLIYSAKGIFPAKALPERDSGSRFNKGLPIPAVHGDFYVRLDFISRNSKQKPGTTSSLSVHLAGNDSAIIRLNDVAVRPGIEDDLRSTGAITIDQRVHLVPNLNLLATLPEANDSVVVRDFDLDREIEKSGIDYLFVTSRPPAMLLEGEAFDYQITTKSKRGSVSYSLAFGPDGLKVSNRGRVTWQASRQAENPVHAVVSVKDASGQEVLHNMRIDVLAMPVADKPTVVPEEHLREWTDASGDFKIKAKFVRAEGARMFFMQKDGTELEIELKDLSLRDQQYVLQKLVELEENQQ